MNKSLLKTVVLWAVALLPVVVTAVLYPSLPEQIPVHWNLDGSITYGEKNTLWFLAALSLGTMVLMKVLPKIDPRRENYKRFGKYYDLTVLTTCLIMDLVFGVTVVETLHPGTLSVSRVITCAVAVLFMVLGNVMPKFKSNFFAGARNPWTLSDPDVWTRTQRLSGQLFFLLGLALAIVGLFLPEMVMFVVLLIGVAILITVPALMSYLWYRQRHREDGE